MEKSRKRNFKKFLNIFVLMLILCLNISVSAEMFSSGDALETVEVFSSGDSIEIPEMPESDEVFENEGNIIMDESDTPSEEESLFPSEGEILGEISSNMKGTATAPRTNTVTVVFKDQNKNAYTELQMSIKMGSTITLPEVPGRENAAGSGWKAELDVVDSEAVKWEPESSLTISDSDYYLADKIINNVLTLYAVPGKDPYKVTFYTGDAQNLLLQKEVKEGTVIELPNFAEAGYKNLGWALKVNASTASYSIGSKYTVKKDTIFFLVRVEMMDAIFRNNAGNTSSFYSKLGKTVEKGTTIIMPELRQVVGYQSIGWSTKKKATVASYKPGQTVVLNADKTFYAVYKYVGKCAVKFNNNSGNTTSTQYSSLNRTVTKNTYIVLPEGPKVSGYQNMGWTTVKKGSTAMYEAGDKVKITKGTRFYLVRKKTYKVSLYTKEGKYWKSVQVLKNSYYELPSLINKDGYTMMGWSTVRGKSVNPKYEVGEKIKVTKNIKLYSVFFVRSKEADYTAKQLDSLSSNLLTKYKKVIFVGDSRTARTESTLKYCGYVPSSYNISFVAEPGKGLAWFKETGYQELLQKVGKSTSKRGKPTAVIFNLGINDLKNISYYVSFMKQIAPTLESRGCELYYMSVNPVNNKLIKSYGKASRPEAKVRSFNATIKSKLCGSSGAYTYIDTYSYLMDNGYGTNANKYGYDVEKDDGIHYTSKTTKRIFRYCINVLRK